MQKEIVEQFIWLLDLFEAETLQECELAQRAAEHEQPVTPGDVQFGRLEGHKDAGRIAETATVQRAEPPLPFGDQALPLIREILIQSIGIDRLPRLAHLQDLGYQIGINVEPGLLRTDHYGDRGERLEYISWLRAKAEILEQGMATFPDAVQNADQTRDPHRAVPAAGISDIASARPWLTSREIADLYPGVPENAIDCFLRRLAKAHPHWRTRNPDGRAARRAKYIYSTTEVIPECIRKWGPLSSH